MLYLSVNTDLFTRNIQKRQTSIRPLVEEYFAWVKEMLSGKKVLPKGETAKGLKYSLNQVFFASTFSSKMQIEFLKVAWGISPVLHFLRRHSFGCRRGAVAGIQSLLVTDM